MEKHLRHIVRRFGPGLVLFCFLSNCLHIVFILFVFLNGPSQPDMVHTLGACIYMSALMLLFIPALLLVLPKIQRRKAPPVPASAGDAVLRLSPDQFTQRDVELLGKVLDGEKYEAIANEYGIAVSTLKNRVGILFRKLEVQDRVTFLVQYARRTLILDSPYFTRGFS
jgi:DNA-binding CsgD family transcriptional regulator